MSTAIVVGSGPNGLSAAVHLAAHGVRVRVLEAQAEIGGGCRSSEPTLPGVVADDCSAFHPLAAASPFLTGLGLEEHGLRWLWPEVQLSHPLDGGREAVLWQDLARTTAGLGADGPAWDALVGRAARDFGTIAGEFLGPLLHVPRHPLALARFGADAVLPATVTARRWRGQEARALFAGIAAHAFAPLHTPLTTSVGLVLAASAHAVGWPVAAGGSGTIAAALAARLADLGGTIETAAPVTSARELDGADLVLLDLAPGAAARLLARRLPASTAAAYARYRHGPAAFKVDFAIEGDIPWQAEQSRRAGTVHLGGTLEEIAAAEADVARGRMPARPFVLVGQQYLADPSRSREGINPIWAYAHVPHGYPGDATEALTAQIERFAPGFRARIRATAVRGPAALEAHNANYVGGDIGTGATSGLQLLARPRLAVNPYATGVPGVYLCSAATPPGPGSHGMSGYRAAQAALGWLARR
ncbi:FAD-dependent oxidoreductase [Sinomonas atrocyanea]|uniref:FAD-dependent oxidoreductase n=1 Tax=Sinomonas atrocyanea TaxID=37927 RepID=A0A127A0K5_9MICC|nr:NAD(P)/FAD-dependent oxidoreductase [Sinomonas atrocyanea]AMM32978.1 FAD-dependent oxidoreductase [Sinomonas atrocyanea]GEB64334.1 putative dehydrogenase [Sinomonas atrocyanea]GGG79729.1 putative dehydrogenase [Sinomonas atrocyanea]